MIIVYQYYRLYVDVLAGSQRVGGDSDWREGDVLKIKEVRAGVRAQAHTCLLMKKIRGICVLPNEAIRTYNGFGWVWVGPWLASVCAAVQVDKTIERSAGHESTATRLFRCGNSLSSGGTRLRVSHAQRWTTHCRRPKSPVIQCTRPRYGSGQLIANCEGRPSPVLTRAGCCFLLCSMGGGPLHGHVPRALHSRHALVWLQQLRLPCGLTLRVSLQQLALGLLLHHLLDPHGVGLERVAHQHLYVSMLRDG